MGKITNQSTLTSKYTLPDYSTGNITTQSNVSETENMTTSFSKVKSCDRSYLVAGDEIEIELTLQNDSEFDLENVVIVDTLSDNLMFVTGSVKVDDTTMPTYDIQNSIQLPNPIVANSSAKVSYRADVTAGGSSSAFCISNIAYDVNGVHLSENSNKVDFTIENVNITINKTSNHEAVIAGQQILFQNIIRNDGSVKATDLFFSDPIPAGTSFVENSVEIDGTRMADYNPETGFKLPDLEPSTQTIITFTVLVNA